MRRICTTCCFLLFFAGPSMAEVKGSVADLAWMTGSWFGDTGAQILEESWIRPASGTLACVVRLRSGETTHMVELILIENEGDSLVFRVRQWHPGFVPRDPPGQQMRLAEIGERRVSFVADGPGDFARLTYSRPEPEQFQIDVEPREGAPFQILLRPQ